MVAFKVFGLVLAYVAACQAIPIWVDGNGYIPGVVMRIGRSPSISYGFGSGFSSDIGGIRHSSSIGSAFQSGGGQAYGSGLASTGANGDTYARGVGIANAAPSYSIHPQPLYTYTVPAQYNTAAAVSSVQSRNGPHYYPSRYQTAVSSAQSVRGLGYESAVSAAQNSNGLQYNSAVSAAENAGQYGSAVSAAQTQNGASDFGSAVSAAQNVGGVRSSVAEAVQQRGNALQHSGANTISSPGLQAAHAHAINAGGYY